MTVLFVPESRDEAASVPIDWSGLVLLSVGLLCLLFGFTRAGDVGWVNSIVVGSCLSGVVLLVLFIFVESRVRWPLIDLALFRNRPFVLGCLSFFFFSAAIFGSQPYWSLFMQNTWRFSPLQGGLGFLPATALIVLLTPLAGILTQRVKASLYLLLAAGLLLCGLSFLYVVIILSPRSTYVSGLLPTFLMRGLAIPFIVSGLTLTVVSSVSANLSGLASGTLGMARNIGTALGVAILGQVYLFHVNTALPALFKTSRTMADQFIIAGSGVDYLLAEAAIFQGFKLTALACFVFCGSAMALICCSRLPYRSKEATTPSQEHERCVSVS
jgi:DHA2 family methylenomycin A resistance protein-like MFS transporter